MSSTHTTPARLVISDLDGTLLDHATYAFDAARQALGGLANARVPLVFATSKTRAEVLALRRALDNRDPFIVENGGAIVVPAGYFPFPLSGATPGPDGDLVIPLGTPHAILVEALAAASRDSGVAVRGFSSWGVAGVSALTGLAPHAARLSLAREWDEPFEIVGPEPDALARLTAAIEARALRVTRGARFHHIVGGSDKGEAARRLIAWYRQVSPALTVLALGDAPNDEPLLAVADVAVVVRGTQAAALRARFPRAHLTRLDGPAGWNETVLAWLADASTFDRGR